MENIQKLYETYLEECESNFLLGETPPSKIELLSNDKLVDYFLYTYSYLGIAATEFMSIARIKLTLKKSLEMFNDKDISSKQKWWLLCLEYLKIGTTYYKVHTIDSVIDTIILKVNHLSHLELMLYSNLLNDSLYAASGYELRMRPSESKCNIDTVSSLYLRMVQNSSKIVSILDNYFEEEELLCEDVLREIEYIEKLDYPYEVFDIIFDLFTGTSVALAECVTTKKEEIKDVLIASLQTFALDDQYSNSKIELASTEILNLLVNQKHKAL